MANYVFTNSMKRYERSNLCIKLYNEMVENGQLMRILNLLMKVIDEKKHRKNPFKPSNDPIYAIKLATYKGAPFYLIVDKTKDFDIVFNTSPIDAAYVEFVKVITEETAIVFTQHALDRYNERIHGDAYHHHRDIMKRFIVNNPIKTDVVFDERSGRAVQRVNEGFLCGYLDLAHHCLIMNTFFDCDGYMDNFSQAKARTEYKRMAELPPEKAEKYREINNKLHMGIINQDKFDFLLFINRLDV